MGQTGRNRLDRFDLSVRLVLCHLAADLGWVEEDDFPEGFLCVPCDPERGVVAHHQADPAFVKLPDDLLLASLADGEVD